MKLEAKNIAGMTQNRLKESIEICRELNQKNKETMLVGGCVRDLILEENPKDFDLATKATPDEVCSIFQQKNQAKRKVIPTGKDHGTMTIVGKFGAYEVTTLRADKDTDGRHATVEFLSLIHI